MRFFIFLLLLSFSFECLAQTANPVVRTQKTPDYFIPREELDKKEILPEFPGYEAEEPESDDKTVNEEEDSRTEHQKDFGAYKRDLQNISADGVIPENPELNRDLEQMNSDEKWIVK